jgi:hypothetical protein
MNFFTMAALQAVLYVFSVLFTWTISTTALSHSRVYQTLTAAIVPRQKLGMLGSLVSEYAMFFIIAKLFILYELRGLELVDWMGWVYTADVLNILFLWSLFLQAVFSRHPLYEQTKFMRDHTSSLPTSVFSFGFWFRFHNPFWSSHQLLIQSNINYATKEELESIKETQPNCAPFMTLDVYQHPSFPRQRPVVVSML